MKTWTKLLSLMVLFIAIACTSDDDPKEQPDPFENLEHDYLLVGHWAISPESKEEAMADELQLFADGTGKYTVTDKNGTLKWGTSQHTLKIELDNGTLNENEYTIEGVTLKVGSKETYTLDFPILGEWYVNNPNGERPVNSFAYYFRSDGTGFYQYFNKQGILVYLWQAKWQRLENGSIMFQADNQERELSYRISGSVLTISDEGDFVRQNKWGLPGTWRSEYTETGKLENGGYRYGYIRMNMSDYDNHFSCSYYDEAGYNRNLECSWKKSSEFYLPLFSKEEDWQEFMLFYRHKYNSTSQQIYLEISKDEDFKQYVGYSRTNKE